MGTVANRTIAPRPVFQKQTPRPRGPLNFKHPSRVEIVATLVATADERGVSLAALSLMLDRNVTYLQQFVTKGSPKRLAEDDRRTLAMFFGIDERRLGALDPWTPEGGGGQ
jgi:hypothetical protein